MHLKTFLTLIIVLFICDDLFAQQQSRTVFRFLELQPDARQTALGGPHPAVVDPGFSQFTVNPAFLFTEQKHNLQASYQNHLGDVNYGSASYFRPVNNIGNAALSVRYLNYGSMTEYDEQGNDLGSLSANDLALTAGFATQLAGNLYYGVSVTGIYSSLAGYQASGVSFSGGLLYQFSGRETTIGASVQNAGSQVSAFNEQREPLPLNIAVGVVHRLRYLPVRLHYSIHRLNNPGLETANDEDVSIFNKLMRHSLLGTEFLFGEYVTVRLGYDHFLHEQLKTGKRLDGAGLSMGFGLSLQNIDLHFARTSFSDLGNVIQLGMLLSI